MQKRSNEITIKKKKSTDKKRAAVKINSFRVYKYINKICLKINNWWRAFFDRISGALKCDRREQSRIKHSTACRGKDRLRGAKNMFSNYLFILYSDAKRKNSHLGAGWQRMKYNLIKTRVSPRLYNIYRLDLYAYIVSYVLPTCFVVCDESYGVRFSKRYRQFAARHVFIESKTYSRESLRVRSLDRAFRIYFPPGQNSKFLRVTVREKFSGFSERITRRPPRINDDAHEKRVRRKTNDTPAGNNNTVSFEQWFITWIPFRFIRCSKIISWIYVRSDWFFMIRLENLRFLKVIIVFT